MKDADFALKLFDLEMIKSESLADFFVKKVFKPFEDSRACVIKN
jgi:hypothetical protein